MGTTLICGRISIFYLDSVKGDINKKIEDLEKQGFLGMKGSKEMILKANQKVRGLFAHDVNYFPSASETLAIFGDTLFIIKIINSYLKKIKQGDESVLGKVIESLKSKGEQVDTK